MDFFSQTYTALRGPQGAQQTPEETVGRLADRLSPETQLADRRAAVLALKGLTRKHRALVADQCLPGLVRIVREDAAHDPEIARAALEAVLMREYGTGAAKFSFQTTSEIHKKGFLKNKDRETLKVRKLIFSMY